MSSPPAARSVRLHAVLTAAVAIVAILTATFFAFNAPPTVTVTNTVTQPEPCGGQLVWNINSNTSKALPVLLMQPGSVGYICITYQSAWQGNPGAFLNMTRGAPFGNGTYEFGMEIGTMPCTQSDGGTNCVGVVSYSFRIGVNPRTIVPTNATDLVDVVYTVRALANSTGFYDFSAPFEYCYGMPMAVGYPAAQVNATDFAPRLMYPCPFEFFTPYSVSVSGMSVTYVRFSP